MAQTGRVSISTDSFKDPYEGKEARTLHSGCKGGGDNLVDKKVCLMNIKIGFFSLFTKHSVRTGATSIC